MRDRGVLTSFLFGAACFRQPQGLFRRLVYQELFGFGLSIVDVRATYACGEVGGHRSFPCCVIAHFRHRIRTAWGSVSTAPGSVSPGSGLFAGPAGPAGPTGAVGGGGGARGSGAVGGPVCPARWARWALRPGRGTAVPPDHRERGSHRADLATARPVGGWRTRRPGAEPLGVSAWPGAGAPPGRTRHANRAAEPGGRTGWPNRVAESGGRPRLGGAGGAGDPRRAAKTQPIVMI